MFHYKIYGLRIQSEFKIEEALEVERSGDVDVVICHGCAPKEFMERMEQTSSSPVYMYHTNDALFLYLDKIAVYYVTRDKIMVDEAPEVTLEQIKCYLLGTALGFCMTLRGMIAVHGGGVALSGSKGIIITGESGAGKSTVTNTLREKGYSFIADDVCALSFREEQVHINLAYPQQKLCRDAVIRMGYNLKQCISLDEERDKFAIRLKDGYLTDGAPFGYLFELGTTQDDVLVMQEVRGYEKVLTLIRNIYRGEFSLKMWGLLPDTMKNCARIASQIRVYKIYRPAKADTLDEIVAFIENTTVGER